MPATSIWISDAVIDAFTDPDFGLGGTNLKGYTVGGSWALPTMSGRRCAG